ncbi:MAG: glycoside hydrolase family 43 protein [Faecousia sp.]
MKIQYETVDNMANVQADDPFVTEQGGNYYYCWSQDGGIWVARIRHPGAVSKENGVKVFDGDANGLYSIWAPELHNMDGCWYIYAAMCKGGDSNALHRMYCLAGTGESPLEPFTLKGQVTDSTDKWAIDGTVFQYGGQWYTIWSGWPGKKDVVQNLYIARLSDPWTIDSERVLISRPDGWDSVTKQPGVNEGPCVVIDGETVYCLYSGNGSWTDDYGVGFLTFSGGDILRGENWRKNETPILSKQAGFYGPGHCSVTADAEGGLWILYHANLRSGTGWDGRSFRLQKLNLTDIGPAVGKQQWRVEVPFVHTPDSYFMSSAESLSPHCFSQLLPNEIDKNQAIVL